MEELKIKIRRDRILAIMNYAQYKNFVYYKYNVSEQPTKLFSLNDVTEEDIINSENNLIKRYCVKYLTDLVKYTKIHISVLETIKSMNVEESLQFTYRLHLLSQIYKIYSAVQNDISTDDLEELYDRVFHDYNEEKIKNKRWFNIF